MQQPGQPPAGKFRDHGGGQADVADRGPVSLVWLPWPVWLAARRFAVRRVCWHGSARPVQPARPAAR
eukprot:11179717-Lingulodinium_polyedra.AAC.1